MSLRCSVTICRLTAGFGVDLQALGSATGGLRCGPGTTLPDSHVLSSRCVLQSLVFGDLLTYAYFFCRTIGRVNGRLSLGQGYDEAYLIIFSFKFMKVCFIIALLR